MRVSQCASDIDATFIHGHGCRRSFRSRPTASLRQRTLDEELAAKSKNQEAREESSGHALLYDKAEGDGADKNDSRDPPYPPGLVYEAKSRILGDLNTLRFRD